MVLASVAGGLALQRALKTHCTLASAPARGSGRMVATAATFSLETGFRPSAEGRRAGLLSGPSLTQEQSSAAGSTLDADVPGTFCQRRTKHRRNKAFLSLVQSSTMFTQRDRICSSAGSLISSCQRQLSPGSRA